MPLCDIDELLVIKMHGVGRKSIKVGDRLAIRPARLRQDRRADIPQMLGKELGTDPLVVREMAYWSCGAGMIRFMEGGKLGDWRHLSNYVAL